MRSSDLDIPQFPPPVRSELLVRGCSVSYVKQNYWAFSNRYAAFRRG
jgi:hypothetical protein